MMHPTVDFKNYLKSGVRVHLAGIGGVSMCPLAEVLHGMGLCVQGSDMTESDTVRHLRALGIPVAIGHAAENLQNAQLVIRTAAIHDDNPEISGAVARGIPVYERAQAWGAIMQQYQNALCISGTHGKTTTTSMATHIFMAAQADPTVMIGGTLPMLHSGYRVGHGDTIILESCEYCNSFLNFFPTVAVILNVEADHLDFFRDLADVRIASPPVVGQLRLAQQRQHPVHARRLGRSAHIADRRPVQIFHSGPPGQAQPAAYQQLKHRVAAVRQPQRADLVDLARGHRQMKQIFQADLLRNT